MRALPAFLLSLVALAVAPTAEAAWGMPDALTDRGRTVGDIYNTVAILGILVFLIVFVWLVIVVWRFRETTGHGRSTHEGERHSIKAELAWFLIPLAIVLYIGYIAYAGLVVLDHGIPPESIPPEDQVRIAGSQWTWVATYPGGVRVDASPDGTSGAVADDNVFYVPANRPILYNVTATDVIHAFQVMDANRAYVMFVDANPLGATKYNMQVASLPEGEYYVQCNKMCLNPGHAFMRARIKAVPADEYTLWHNERLATQGASILQRVALRADASGALVSADGQAPGPYTVVSSLPGTRVVVTLSDLQQDVTLSAPGAPDKTFRAGERLDPFYGFTVAQSGETILRATIGDQVQSIVFQGVDAMVQTVQLGNFVFIPSDLTFEATKTHLVNLPNIDALPHNLFIGSYNGGNNPVVLEASQTVPAGGEGSLLVAPREPGTFDIWCNIPGHAAAGMVGTATFT